jgi:hypothetical protein
MVINEQTESDIKATLQRALQKADAIEETMTIEMARELAARSAELITQVMGLIE